MGTDIHLYVERRNAAGVWERATPEPWPCPWCEGEAQRHSDCYNCKGAGKTRSPYDLRNYDLFAMLANVRNGRGFAGVVTGSGFVPLAKPRGRPDDTAIVDTCDAVEYEDPQYVWLGDHSFSYATLAEVLSYDYGQITHQCGVVGAKEYRAWVEAGRRGAPKSWSAAVFGNCTTVTPAEIDLLLQEGVVKASDDGNGYVDAMGGRYYVEISWSISYRDAAGPAWFAFLDACKPLGAPEDVRFVFGFDS
jgi:hypothetical protein